MRVWKMEGYEVHEVEYDGDLHEFEIVKDGEVITSILPIDMEDMEFLVADLDSGRGVNGWRDIMGNIIYIEGNIIYID